MNYSEEISMEKNKTNLETMRRIIEEKQKKSAVQRGLGDKAAKTMGEARKKIYVKKAGGLFDK